MDITKFDNFDKLHEAVCVEAVYKLKDEILRIGNECGRDYTSGPDLAADLNSTRLIGGVKLALPDIVW